MAEASVIGIIDPEGGDRIPRGFIVLKAEYLQAEENQKKKLVKEIQDFVDGKLKILISNVQSVQCKSDQ